MAANQRKARRTRLDRRCWVVVDVGQPRRECLVQDVSQTGARIALTPGAALPNVVDLYFTRIGGGVVRKSEVIWQTANEAGLHFIDPAQAQKASAPGRQQASSGS
jgi:hypothetical protein